MNHQVQDVMDDFACNAQDDWSRRQKHRVNGDTCEGSGDVVGVLTLLVGGAAQAFHDDRVVELRVQLGVEEVEGKDREEQVEVEREKRVKEGAPWMVCRWL